MTNSALDEDSGWLLLKIASGRGHEVSIPARGNRTAHRLEAMAQANLITCRRDDDGWRCAILKRGRAALTDWKAHETEEAERRLRAHA